MMKILTLLGFLLLSFNSFAKINLKCGKHKFNRSEFKGKMYFVEVQSNCVSNIDPADFERFESLLARRFQKAPDVAKVHETGNEDFKGMSGRYVVSNLKSTIQNRGNMDVKYHTFIGLDNKNRIRAHSRSLKIKATGYSRYTKKINRFIMVSIINNKVHFVFKELDKIEKPGIAPRGIFEPAAKKGLAKNHKKNINFLMNYLDKIL